MGTEVCRNRGVSFGVSFQVLPLILNHGLQPPHLQPSPRRPPRSASLVLPPLSPQRSPLLAPPVPLLLAPQMPLLWAPRVPPLLALLQPLQRLQIQQRTSAT